EGIGRHADRTVEVYKRLSRPARRNEPEDNQRPGREVWRDGRFVRSHSGHSRALRGSRTWRHYHREALYIIAQRTGTRQRILIGAARVQGDGRLDPNRRKGAG